LIIQIQEGKWLNAGRKVRAEEKEKGDKPVKILWNEKKTGCDD